MSREDVEWLRAGYDALNRGEFSGSPEKLEALIDPEFELRDPTLPELDQSTRGPAVLVASFEQMREAFKDVRYEIDDVVDLGNRILLRVTASGRGKGSGVPIGGTMGHLWWVRHGKALRLHVFESWESALAAVEREATREA
jgi:ketosteroid isomerase-like protein